MQFQSIDKNSKELKYIYSLIIFLRVIIFLYVILRTVLQTLRVFFDVISRDQPEQNHYFPKLIKLKVVTPDQPVVLS